MKSIVIVFGLICAVFAGSPLANRKYKFHFNRFSLFSLRWQFDELESRVRSTIIVISSRRQLARKKKKKHKLRGRENFSVEN